MTTEEPACAEDPNVIAIGDLRLRRIQRGTRAHDACQHKHLEMDPDGEILTCTDCGKQLSAFWVLERMLRDYQNARRAVRAEWEQARWERQKSVRTIAARQIEATWRRRMAPCCPHCQAGILPEDGLGGAAVSRELELQRRGKEVAP